jgi:hypothetical protein
MGMLLAHQFNPIFFRSTYVGKPLCPWYLEEKKAISVLERIDIVCDAFSQQEYGRTRNARFMTMETDNFPTVSQVLHWNEKNIKKTGALIFCVALHKKERFENYKILIWRCD